MTKLSKDLDALEGVRALLRAVGEDPDREGLRDTPKRVLKALREMTEGVAADAAEILKVSFDSGDYDQLVCVAGIPFVSNCEHHLLPFHGKAAVAYLPGRADDGRFRVVGLSKLARIVEVFARRLQLQEQMTAQIAAALEKHLNPRGVAVLIEAEHMCMMCRGVRKAGSLTGTSDMRGVFRTDAAARAEVLALINRCSK